jgi:hypothetical protein
MTAPADPSAERGSASPQLTTRQLGGYVLLAALLLAVVRLVRRGGRRKPG